MEEEKEVQETKRISDGLSKIAVSKEADEAVAEIMSRVSDGFDAGRTTKHEVASQMILRFAKSCVEADIHAMRALFFNPLTVMEAMIKKAKESGEVPDSMREFLYEQFMASSTTQPKSKKGKNTLKSNVINDNNGEIGEVA